MFITVDGFNKTGIPNVLWNFVEPHAHIDSAGGIALLTLVILFLSNVASNVPTVLLLGARVAASAAAISPAREKKAWLLLAWVSTVAGNLSLLGSAENLIVCEQARRAQFFRDVTGTYCKEVRRLGFQLLGLISLSLWLEEDYIERVLGEQEQHMAVNYYPQCPEPDLTYGLTAHTDPNALTILLQDPKVAGLQVLKDGIWNKVNPIPNALVINMGDQLQEPGPGALFGAFQVLVASIKLRCTTSQFDGLTV